MSPFVGARTCKAQSNASLTRERFAIAAQNYCVVRECLFHAFFAWSGLTCLREMVRQEDSRLRPDACDASALAG